MMAAAGRLPYLAVTQGDPAGVGPETLVALAGSRSDRFRPLLVAERSALSPALELVETSDRPELVYLGSTPSRDELDDLDAGLVPVLDPVGEPRQIVFGTSGPADAAGAMACLDSGIELARSRIVDALVTAPVSKLSIATQHLPGFRGHTDYLAESCGLEEYGRDYLMAFLAPDLQVALVTTHLSLVEAIAGLSPQSIEAAAVCLERHAGGRIAVAGLNPHAGEGGLMGMEDSRVIRPAVEACRARGIDAVGPESADSLFARSRRGEFDWVLALLHDQGLIAVKTLYFGEATNWTLGLPFIRTSVDHGTAFDMAGRGLADSRPLEIVCQTTCDMVAGIVPRRGSPR
jgi:4-hydroxythreonine-4-phosphate dehydrogenase